MLYIPNHATQRIVNVGWNWYYPSHQVYKLLHNDHHTSRQQQHVPHLTDANHPHSINEHRQNAHATWMSHYHDLQETLISARSAPYPTRQTFDDLSDARDQQRVQFCNYIPPDGSTYAVLQHAQQPYSANSFFNCSISCGTPTTPRSLIWVSGLRIIAVSGFPGSTKYIGT